jgi:hypothetical protein
VGGAGQAVWPNLPNQHLRLTADRETYRPGQTARVFIPNPYGEKTLALVTVERGVILDSQLVELDESGSTFSLPLTDDHAPNVYISATLIDVDDFRQGYLNLAVEPKAQALHVELTSQPERAQPGEQVTLALHVTDAQGKPVQGEFSLSVVDLAALALADPNALDILPAFYGEQPLGIRTSLALAAFSKRFAPSSIESPGGLGGGGGGGEALGPIVRENFPDTAYWNPTLVTDADGNGQVTLALPDSLTTWHVDARGLTSDTRVGQAETQVITTKPLLIRPVTPRFLVVGDHVELAAIVHNNTDKNLQTSANLKVSGFSLDKTSKPSQTVKIPAGGRVRLTWWGTAQDTDSADLLFSVKASGVDQALQDTARPVWGALPVLHYTAPQTFVTAGVLPEAGSRLEIISLPRTFVPTGGGLDVEMSPSLAAAVLDALEAMKEPSINAGSERVLSYVLPNLAVYRSLQGAGLESPALKERLDGCLDDSLRRLLALQNSDGGWGWYAKGQSNPYITGYILFGLQQIKEAGVRVDEKAIQNGRDFLVAARPYLGGEPPQAWEMERLAFTEFILQETGGAGTQAVEALYGWRDRLSPWARALLALTLEDISPGETRARELISNLETTAIRSASGAHWEVPGEDWRDPGTPRFTTALVVYALAQRDPAAPILTDAVRYLASQRSASGQWGSPYETAWVILALNEAMQGSGELQSDFAFSADLNGTAIISGQSSGPASLTPVTAGTPVDQLYSKTPNALTFSRQPGNGRLYYRAALQVDQPVELVKPLKQGMQVDRAYYDPACKQNCSVLDSVKLDQGARLAVRLTLSLPHDSYYVMLEDYIPAGSEILNKALMTSQEGRGPTTWAEFYDPHDPFAGGSGWWLINAPQIFDDHILWMAEYLPAGTYTLTYTLIPLQAGEYHLLPVHAWQAYFPEVQGTSAGAIFEIKP